MTAAFVPVDVAKRRRGHQRRRDNGHPPPPPPWSRRAATIFLVAFVAFLVPSTTTTVGVADGGSGASNGSTTFSARRSPPPPPTTTTTTTDTAAADAIATTSTVEEEEEEEEEDSTVTAAKRPDAAPSEVGREKKTDDDEYSKTKAVASLCVNCHALFRIRATVRVRREDNGSLSSPASSPTTDDLVLDRLNRTSSWSVRLREIGPNDDALSSSDLGEERPLDDLRCERTTTMIAASSAEAAVSSRRSEERRREEDGGRGPPTSTSTWVVPEKNAEEASSFAYACSSIVLLSIPYSSLLSSSSSGSAGGGGGREALVLATLLRRDRRHDSEGAAERQRQRAAEAAVVVVDRRLATVTVPASRDEEDYGGSGIERRRVADPIHSLTLVDDDVVVVAFAPLDDDDAAADDSPREDNDEDDEDDGQLSGTDWREIGVGCFHGAFGGLVVLAIARWRLRRKQLGIAAFGDDPVAHWNVLFEEEEGSFRTPTPSSSSSGSRRVVYKERGERDFETYSAEASIDDAAEPKDLSRSPRNSPQSDFETRSDDEASVDNAVEPKDLSRSLRNAVGSPLDDGANDPPAMHGVHGPYDPEDDHRAICNDGDHSDDSASTPRARSESATARREPRSDPAFESNRRRDVDAEPRHLLRSLRNSVGSPLDDGDGDSPANGAFRGIDMEEDRRAIRNDNADNSAERRQTRLETTTARCEPQSEAFESHRRRERRVAEPRSDLDEDRPRSPREDDGGVLGMDAERASSSCCEEGDDATTARRGPSSERSATSFAAARDDDDGDRCSAPIENLRSGDEERPRRRCTSVNDDAPWLSEGAGERRSPDSRGLVPSSSPLLPSDEHREYHSLSSSDVVADFAVPNAGANASPDDGDDAAGGPTTRSEARSPKSLRLDDHGGDAEPSPRSHSVVRSTPEEEGCPDIMMDDGPGREVDSGGRVHNNVRDGTTSHGDASPSNGTTSRKRTDVVSDPIGPVDVESARLDLAPSAAGESDRVCGLDDDHASEFPEARADHRGDDDDNRDPDGALDSELGHEPASFDEHVRETTTAPPLPRGDDASSPEEDSEQVERTDVLADDESDPRRETNEAAFSAYDISSREAKSDREGFGDVDDACESGRRADEQNVLGADSCPRDVEKRVYGEFEGRGESGEPDDSEEVGRGDVRSADDDAFVNLSTGDDGESEEEDGGETGGNAFANPNAGRRTNAEEARGDDRAVATKRSGTAQTIAGVRADPVSADPGTAPAATKMMIGEGRDREGAHHSASPKGSLNRSVSSSAITSRIYNGKKPKGPATAERLNRERNVPSAARGDAVPVDRPSFPIARKRARGKRQRRQPAEEIPTRVSTSPLQICRQQQRQHLPDQEGNGETLLACEEGKRPAPSCSLELCRRAEESAASQRENYRDTSVVDPSPPSSGRIPLSTISASHDRAHLVRDDGNSRRCPSPTSTVNATVHDFVGSRRKLRTTRCEVRGERPVPVPSGDAGQSKRFGASASPSLSTADEAWADARFEVDSRRRLSYNQITAGDDNAEPLHWPRKKLRSKKKRRSIEKKLLATKAKRVMHKPSSELIPLSREIEEPAWQLSGVQKC